MKKYFIILFITSAIAIISCEKFLETEPTGQLTVPETYQSEGGVKLALNGLYLIFNNNYYGSYGGVKVYGITPAAIRYITYLTDAAGDDMMIRNTENVARTSIDRYQYDADNENIDRIYFSGFRGIKDCNNFLDNMKLSSIDDEAFKKSAEAEARAIRAFIYFSLVRLYGDLPIIFTSEPADSYQRQNYAEVYRDLIIPDLEFAIGNLPDVHEGNDRGRITSVAAQAMLAEVYLTLAGNIYDYPSVADSRTVADVFEKTRQDFLTLCTENCMGVIANDNYGLFPDYEKLFTVEGNNSMESVWEVPKDGNQMPMELLPPATEFPLQKFPDDTTLTYQGLFPRYDEATKQVVAISGWGRYVMSPNLQILYDSLYDTRLKTIIRVRTSDSETGQVINLWYSKKFADSTAVYERLSTDPRDSRANFKTIRYAHVLLTYAEALNEINQGPTAEASDALLQVIRRAYKGNEDKISALPGDYPGFKEAVMNERRKELYFEGHRWYDLVRTGTLKEMVEASPYGPNGVNYPVVEEKHYLYPLPNKAFRLNPYYEGKQNPGW